VTAPPERGRANDAAVKLLADALRIAPESVTLVGGHGSRDKVVEIVGLDQAEAERRLAG
jgi:uncharacterized protein